MACLSTPTRKCTRSSCNSSLPSRINGGTAKKYSPEETTWAQVSLILKQCSKANLNNYRPISLLCINYTIFTALLQKRLADVLDKHIQSTQFGFRRKKNTAQVVHYVRRVMGKGEQVSNKNIVFPAGLGKGIDKVKYPELLKAPRRMNAPVKYVKVFDQPSKLRWRATSPHGRNKQQG